MIDAYKFFDGTGVNAYNLIASIGTLVLAIGIVMTLVNAILSRVNGPEAGHDPWGGDSLEWFTLSPPEPHNFDVLPDVRSARPMRDIRDAIAHRTGRAEAPARESPAGSLTGMEAGAGAQTAPTPTAATAAPRSAAMTVVRDYLTLTKPKVQSLLLFTTVTTMYVAGDPSLGLIFLTCLGGALSAGGAGAINHAVDRDIDRTMARTADRPVASGRVSPAAAIAFGTLLGCASFALLALTVNPLAAALSLSGLLGYVFVYTLWLKRTTPQNIVIGGAAGAVPPLVAWAAVTGEPQRHGLLPLRDRLLLDPAALLGALAADEGRVREGRHPDAAGGPRRGRDAAPDPPLHRPALRGHPAALLRRRPRRRLPGPLDAARRRLHLLLRPSCCAPPTAAGRSAPTSSRSPTWRCCSSRWRSPPTSSSRGGGAVRTLAAGQHSDGSGDPASRQDRPRPDRNPAVDRETARKNMSAGLVAGGFAAAIFALCFVAAFLYIAQ